LPIWNVVKKILRRGTYVWTDKFAFEAFGDTVEILTPSPGREFGGGVDLRNKNRKGSQDTEVMTM
jgi:hypothetical protein